MTTKLIYELIPSARKLERRYYRLTPVRLYTERRKEMAASLGPASFHVLDSVLSLIDDVKTAATFDEICLAYGRSRATVAKHLALLVEAELLEVLPAQARLVVTED